MGKEVLLLVRWELYEKPGHAQFGRESRRADDDGFVGAFGGTANDVPAPVPVNLQWAWVVGTWHCSCRMRAHVIWN